MGLNTTLPQRETGLLREMTDSRLGARNIKVEPGVFYSARKEVLKKEYRWWRYIKGTEEPPGGFPSGQSWNNLRNKISSLMLDYNPKHKVSIHESVPM